MSERISSSATKRIKQIAEHWRFVLDKEHLGLDIQLKRFPFGSCSAASTILCWALRHEGFDANIVTVCSEDTSFSHAWVIVKDLHIDITGDQFFSLNNLCPPSVYVSTQPPIWSKNLPLRPYSEDDSADASIRYDYLILVEKYGID